MSKVYKGRRATDGETAVVVTEQVQGGQHSYNLAHRVGAGSHSPTGFEWGYGGSGPAELARAILVDFLGDLIACENCDGSGTYEEGGESAPCWECDKGITLSPGIYQDFKWQVVAGLPKAGFELTSAKVAEWFRAYVSGMGATEETKKLAAAVAEREGEGT